MISFHFSEYDLKRFFDDAESEDCIPCAIIEELPRSFSSNRQVFIENVNRAWKCSKELVIALLKNGSVEKEEVYRRIELEINQLKDCLKEQFSFAEDMLQRRLSRMKRKILLSALQGFPSELRLSDVLYLPSKIHVKYELKVSNDFKLSLLELIDFLIEGRIMMSVAYDRNLQ